MAKMSIIFNGFEKLAAELDGMGKDLHPAVNEALTETQKYVQQGLEAAAETYQKKGGGKGWTKGDMYKAIIKDASIEWEDYYLASVKVGFNLDAKGGFHSVFIMYGVPMHGKFNKGYAKDTKVYNAIRGVRTKNQIKKLQKAIMEKYLKLGR